MFRNNMINIVIFIMIFSCLSTCIETYSSKNDVTFYFIYSYEYQYNKTYPTFELYINDIFYFSCNDTLYPNDPIIPHNQFKISLASDDYHIKVTYSNDTLIKEENINISKEIFITISVINNTINLEVKDEPFRFL